MNAKARATESLHDMCAGGQITDLLKKKLNMADRAKQPVEDKKVSGAKWW